MSVCQPALLPTVGQLLFFLFFFLRFFWFHFLKQSLWLKDLLYDAELMRDFWAQLFGHGVFPYFCEEERREAQPDAECRSGAAQQRGEFPAALTCQEHGGRSRAPRPGRSHRARPEPPRHGGLRRAALPRPWSAAPRPAGLACATAPSCR